jgi:hypothetical protein
MTDVFDDVIAERDRLKQQVDTLTAEVKDYEASFDLYDEASMALMHAYMRAHPEVPENVWPDVTQVNVWAAEQIAMLAEALERERLEHQETRGTVAAWKQELTWECGCGARNGVNLAECGLCQRARSEPALAATRGER